MYNFELKNIPYHEYMVYGTKIYSELKLSDEQYDVFKYIARFLSVAIDKNSVDTFVITLSGYAGTGKTTLTKLIQQYNDRQSMKRKSLAGVAPTHKAKKVIHNILNTNCWTKVPCMTVASLLKKQRQAGFVGSKKFKGLGSKMGTYQLLFVDEASMIHDKDATAIIEFAKQAQTKVIFIGDDAQIPNPNQNFRTLDDGRIQKKDSLVFELSNKQQLTKVMRQKTSNPLGEHIHDKIRFNIMSEIDNYEHTSRVNDEDEGVDFVSDMKHFIDKIKYYFDKDKSANEICRNRIIAYTNKSVDEYNKIARQFRFGSTESDFVVGELVMGYENVGYPEPHLENGQDYEVINTQYTCCHNIKLSNNTFTNLEGSYITIVEKNRWIDHSIINGNTHIIFVPNIYSPLNIDIINELVRRAQIVNKYNSTIKDMKNYYELKEKIIFKEALFKFNNNIIGEHDFKEIHPLLFTKVLDVINEDGSGKRTIIKNKLAEKIIDNYPNLIENRINDRNILGDTEEIKDIFQIINKDISYGYAISVHKSQSTTHDNVLIDEMDIDNHLRDIWNHKYNKMESRSKERNQLKYVAFSRPIYKATVLSNKANNNIVHHAERNTKLNVELDIRIDNLIRIMGTQSIIINKLKKQIYNKIHLKMYKT